MGLIPSTNHVVRKWYRSPRGKHTPITPQIIEEVALLVAAGATLPVASVACGVGKRWNEWNIVAREHEALGYEPGFETGQSPYVAWLHAMDEAKCAFEVNCVLHISSGHKNWKAYAYLLERRAGGRWREKKEVAVTVRTEQDKAAEMSTEQLAVEVTRMLEADSKSLTDGKDET